MSVAAIPFVPVFLDAFSRLSFWNNDSQQVQPAAPAPTQQISIVSHTTSSTTSAPSNLALGRRRSSDFVHYVPSSMVPFAVSTMQTVMRDSCRPAPPNVHVPPLHSFISSVVNACPVNAFTIAVALIYVERFKASLSPSAIGSHDTRHRLFMVALMLASKFLNDQSLTNKAWAKASNLFTLAEISNMEMDFLCVLRFNMFVDRSEVDKFLRSSMAHYDESATRQLEDLRANVIFTVETAE